MPLAVAIRHVAFEDLGSFAAVLECRGWAVSYRDATVDDLADAAVMAADLLIVLGGPIGAYEEALYPFLVDELHVIEQRLAAGRPVLGICLGSQLMARALGARVYPGSGKEIGWAPLQLTEAGRASCLASLGEGTPVLHWHGDTFDLPQGAGLLASTPRYRNQAFAWERHGLSLQCHIEVDALGLERWYVGHACEIAATPGLSVPTLRAEARHWAPLLAPRAARSLDAWLDGLPPR
ncbi:MAG TPA: glutamine amidotransferase [Stellaceae bacterium]|nr:glutamine amidotransferase [Stellaceae bacterium]